MALIEPVAGVFIALEGLDGSGKSTIAEHLVGTIRDLGRTAILTREPGGTNIGERVRAIVLDSQGETMFPETEVLLFAAARAQHVRAVILPALERGDVVVSDRFTDSSLAYQWGGRGLPLEAVLAAQELATSGLEPDLKLLLDLSPDVALRRRLNDDGQVNRIDHETLEFHSRVRHAYLELAARDPGRWRVIDANRPADQVWREIRQAVSTAGLVTPDPATAVGRI